MPPTTHISIRPRTVYQSDNSTDTTGDPNAGSHYLAAWFIIAAAFFVFFLLIASWRAKMRRRGVYGASRNLASGNTTTLRKNRRKGNNVQRELSPVEGNGREGWNGLRFESVEEGHENDGTKVPQRPPPTYAGGVAGERREAPPAYFA